MCYNRKRVIWLLCGALIALATCFFQYRYDNKYNFPGPRAREGVLDLSQHAVDQPFSILAYGWELYPQLLLAPGEFDGHEPLFVYLGQYGGFEGANGSGSPHGCATYRLTILLPDQSKEYALELPEIYTSSRVWINGAPVQSLGDVSDVRGKPSTRTGMVTFQAAGQAEIVVQAADYSHYYSGMVYPPAFGSVLAVSDLLTSRLLRTCIVTVAALTIGILYLTIGVKTGEERQRMTLFALSCLAFSLYAVYPLFHQFGAGIWSYRLEDVSFYLFLLMLTALHCSLCGIDGRPRRIVLGVGSGVALLALVVPVLLAGRGLSAMMAYSRFLDCYKLLLFGWLIVTALFNRQKGGDTDGPLLAGLCAIAVSMMFQTVVPVFEPVRTGWMTENAGFLLILLLAGVLWFGTVKAFADRAALTENTRLMKKQFSLQEENYRIVSENFAEIRRMRHDLRHHLNAVMELARQHQYEELEHYISGCEVSANQAVQPALCENHAVNAVLNYYIQQCGQKGIPLELKVALPPELKLEDWNLGLLFGNLLENAVEASEKVPKDRQSVRVYSRIAGGNLLLTVKNAWDGQFMASGEKIASTKHEGTGIGISSVRALVDKCGGQFFLTSGEQEFVVSVVLWQQI